MNNQQYEQSEFQRMLKEQQYVRNSPLSDRRDAMQSYFEAMRDNPELVAERIAWLLNGSYGYAEQKRAEETAKNSRCNWIVGLSQLVAIEEWQCPEAFAVKAWKQLDDTQKQRLASEISKVRENYLSEVA